MMMRRRTTTPNGRTTASRLLSENPTKTNKNGGILDFVRFAFFFVFASLGSSDFSTPYFSPHRLGLLGAAECVEGVGGDGPRIHRIQFRNSRCAERRSPYD